MHKRSWTWLLVVIAVVGGTLVYRYALKPAKHKKGLEMAMDENCEAMAQKFNEEKEEIAQDLSEILDKMDDLDKDEAALRDQIEELRKDVQSDVK